MNGRVINIVMKTNADKIANNVEYNEHIKENYK